MPTRIAVLADLHLPYLPGTAQEAALDWATGVLRAEKPDLAIFAGDVTACGEAEAAQRARERLDDTGVETLMVPGNSDRRNPGTWPRVQALTTAGGVFYNTECAAIALDSSDRVIEENERTRAARMLREAGTRNVLIALHHPPQDLADEDRAWLANLCEQSGRCFLVAGHKHLDREDVLGRTPLRLVRGLDPDKAKGAPPAVAILDLRNGAWTSSKRVFADGDPLSWEHGEREELAGLLGVSCMQDTLRTLQEAARERVRCVEIRAESALDAPAPDLDRAVRHWREAGGTRLSIHLPTLKMRRKGIEDTQALRASADLALRTGGEAMTLHPPRAPVALMQPGSETWSRLLDTVLKTLARPLAEGITLGIENLRLKTDPVDDGQRGFGILPVECLGWVRALREASGRPNIGFHLDVGHARNNRRFARRVTLGVWYALTGTEITGYHIHQVLPGKGGLTNHHPIASIYGPVISYSSFLWAWRAGQIRRAPMFLEVRQKGAGMANLLELRRFLGVSGG